MAGVSIDQGMVLLAVAQELPATPLEVAMARTDTRSSHHYLNSPTRRPTESRAASGGTVPVSCPRLLVSHELDSAYGP
jgi:hypothetical protein